MFRNNFREDAETKPYNIVRILEWVLCSICLSLAIYMLLQIRPLHIVLKSLFLLVAAAYFFITLADIIVTSLLKPLLWTSWIIFDMMGALAFFLCAGFLIIRLYHFAMVLYIASLVANIITGCVFLTELVYIISWLINKKNFVVYIKDRPVPTTSQSTSASSTKPLNKIIRREDKANQFSETHLHFMENNKSMQCPSDALLRRQKFTCIKDTCPKKCTSPEVPSHGGTFHVSKDVAPILSPSPLRSIRTSISSGSTPIRSPRYSCKPASILTENQNSQNRYGNIIEEAVTVKSRTVSTSARMIPTQSQEKIYTVTVKNDSPANDFAQEGFDAKEVTNQLVTGPCHRYSSSSQNQMSAYSSVVHPYYACAYCGRIHKYAATESFSSCGDSIDTCKYQRLPTLHENSSYSSTDEPTKDFTCCPYPSPTTSSSSNKLSPCSGVSVSTYGTYTPRINSNQASPQLNTHLISKSILAKKDNQLPSSGYSMKKCQNSAKKLESQQPSSYSKRKVTDADDLNARKLRSIDHGAGAIFSLEPQCKNKEIQTQPYKIEKQNDFTCTSTSDYNNLSLYERSYCEPTCSSEEKNYEISNWEPTGCFCTAEGMELRLESSNAEKDTVLPGAADRSPRSEVNGERYFVHHPHPQQPTVIDIRDERSSIIPLAHLAPTKCHECRETATDSRQRKTKLQNRPEKCTVM